MSFTAYDMTNGFPLPADLDEVTTPTPARAPRESLERPNAPTGDLVERARLAIAERLSEGTTTVEEIARLLRVSSRTLQRRLHEQQQSLSRLLDEARRERVLQLLSEGASTKAIALDTGFGDVPALYRAFRRWTGTTPRKYVPRIQIPSTPAPALDEHAAGDSYFIQSAQA